MNIYTDYKLVEECLVQIEKKLDWGTSKNWHNEVFNELSDIIQKETKTLLSSTTLKRVWGKVDYKNAPSISTLNTLAQFAGYSNWREFKLKNNNKKHQQTCELIEQALKNWGAHSDLAFQNTTTKKRKKRK